MNRCLDSNYYLLESHLSCFYYERIILFAIRLHSNLELVLPLRQLKSAKWRSLAAWHIAVHRQAAQSVIDKSCAKQFNIQKPFIMVYWSKYRSPC